MFINTNCEEMYVYPQTIVGWVTWMSCSQPDAWCHRMKLKSKGCEQVTVLLAVIIIHSNKCKVHEKQKTFSRLENYLVLRYSFINSRNLFM